MNPKKELLFRVLAYGPLFSETPRWAWSDKSSRRVCRKRKPPRPSRLVPLKGAIRVPLKGSIGFIGFMVFIGFRGLGFRV